MQEATKEWQKCDLQMFWGEIAPSNHLVQIYESEEVIIRSITGFATSGLECGDAVILIATPDHLNAVNDKLKALKFDVEKLKANDQYIALNAYEVLAGFMVVGWPDGALFMNTVKNLMLRARGKENRKVRAYGEMVAILWSQGYTGATVQLEHLWNEFCQKEAFCLYCAYPKSGFTQDIHRSIGHICSTHTKIISGELRSEKEVFYKSA